MKKMREIEQDLADPKLAAHVEKLSQEADQKNPGKAKFDPAAIEHASKRWKVVEEMKTMKKPATSGALSERVLSIVCGSDVSPPNVGTVTLKMSRVSAIAKMASVKVTTRANSRPSLERTQHPLGSGRRSSSGFSPSIAVSA